MKKLIFVISVLFMLGCERKPLYLAEDALACINISVSADINVLWDSNWKNEMIYNWDEGKFGPIGYTIPDDSLVLILFNDNKEVDRMLIKQNTRTSIEVNTDVRYDISIYNRSQQVIEDEHCIVLDTFNIEQKTKIGQRYNSYKEPGELFHTHINDLYISSYYDDDKIEIINGKPTYVINIDSEIKPFSYIYLIQFVIVNDDNTEIEAKGIDNFTISGVSSRKSIITGKSKDNGLSQVITKDIKEGQHIGNSLVFASRMTILDVNTENNSSWDVNENNFYYTIVKLPTYNYGTVSGVVDITNQLRKKPNGGVLTVVIKNSDIKNGGDKTDGTFGITLSEWEENIIDIPF